MAQLLSVACLSLAAKIEENEVPLSLDLQVKKVTTSRSLSVVFLAARFLLTYQ